MCHHGDVIIAFRLKSAMGRLELMMGGFNAIVVIIAFRLKSAMGRGFLQQYVLRSCFGHNRLSAEVRYGT